MNSQRSVVGGGVALPVTCPAAARRRNPRPCRAGAAQSGVHDSLFQRFPTLRLAEPVANLEVSADSSPSA
jgi:hypothetical protein